MYDNLSVVVIWTDYVRTVSGSWTFFFLHNRRFTLFLFTLSSSMDTKWTYDSSSSEGTSSPVTLWRFLSYTKPTHLYRVSPSTTRPPPSLPSRTDLSLLHSFHSVVQGDSWPTHLPSPPPFRRFGRPLYITIRTLRPTRVVPGPSVTRWCSPQNHLNETTSTRTPSSRKSFRPRTYFSSETKVREDTVLKKKREKRRRNRQTFAPLGVLPRVERWGTRV